MKGLTLELRQDSDHVQHQRQKPRPRLIGLQDLHLGRARLVPKEFRDFLEFRDGRVEQLDVVHARPEPVPRGLPELVQFRARVEELSEDGREGLEDGRVGCTWCG